MRIWLIALLSAFLVACGGSGGSSSPNTGTLTLAITDNAIDDWDQALMTLSSVTLIGQGGQETEMLDDPQTVDLLQLRNVSEFLAQRTLTARSISKIRLGITGLTLNRVDMMGLVTESVSPPTPTRKIDLVLQGPVEILPGENVLIEIDFDLHNSIKSNETGNGQVRFRPVVIATAGGSGFARLYGTYTDDGSQSSVCDLERVSDADGTYDVLDMCVPLDETNANYFGADGQPLVTNEPSSSGDLMDGEKISAYGFFSDDGEVLEVEIIARGTGMRGEAFKTLNGLATEDWEATAPSQFGLALADQTLVTVALSEGAKVFAVAEDGRVAGPVQPDSIEGGTRVEARGALDEMEDPDLLQTFIAFTSGAVDTASGTIMAIQENEEAGQHLITFMDPADPTCVVTDSNTRFFDLSPDANDLIQLTEISVGDLVEGDTIDASGELPENVECVIATTVVRDQTTTL